MREAASSPVGVGGDDFVAGLIDCCLGGGALCQLVRRFVLLLLLFSISMFSSVLLRCTEAVACWCGGHTGSISTSEWRRPSDAFPTFCREGRVVRVCELALLLQRHTVGRSAAAAAAEPRTTW